MKVRLLYYFSLIISFFLQIKETQQARAQFSFRPSFKHLTEKDGLSYPFVFDILQDYQGYMWFSTASGLNRFDGKTIKIYQHLPNDSLSLSHDWLGGMLEDKQKRLWLGTSAGLCLYDRVNERFMRIPNPATDTLPLSQKVVHSIIQDSKGNIWVGTIKGLAKFNEKTQKLETYLWQPNTCIHKSATASLVEDDQKANIWFVSCDGIVCFNLQTHQYQYYQEPIPTGKNPLSYNMNMCLSFDKKGRLWVGQWGGGLRIFDRKTKTFTHRFLYEPVSDIRTTTNIINDIKEDVLPNGDSILWVATEHGLGVFSPKNQQFTLIKHNVDEVESLADDAILRIRKTQDNLLWLGLRNKGVDRMVLASPKIHTWHLPIEKDFKGYAFISDIQEDKRDSTGNSFWIAVHDYGIFRWNLPTQKFQYYPFHHQSNLNPYQRDFWHILPHKNTGFWVTTGEGVFDFHYASQTFSPIKTQQKQLNTLPFNAMYQDRKGNVWFAVFWREDKQLEYHFCKYNPQTDAAEWGKIPNCTGAIRSFHEDSAGNMYFITRKTGIYRLEKANVAAANYQSWVYHYTDKNSQLFDLVWNAEWETDDKVWLSGESAVLYDLKQRKILKTLSISEGLSHNHTYQIMNDGLENQWFFTRKGLTRYHKVSKQFSRFYAEDGLFENFAQTTNLLSSQNVMLIGWEKDLQYFHPQTMELNKIFPQMAFTHLDIMAKPQPLQTNEKGELLPITLEWNQKVMSISFAAFDYIHPDRIQYAYQLEGFNAEWVNAGTQNVATYTNLEAGTYTFRVKSTNSDGIWNTQPISIKVIVYPPFWQRMWFKLLVGSLILMLIYLFYQDRIKRIIKETEFQSQLNAINLKALRSQMNPHFIFNSLNAIDNYILSHESAVASSYLNKFAKLMRMILKHSEKDYVSLKEELQMLEYYLQLENLRMEYKFAYQINVAEDLSQENVAIPSMLLQPYIENAIRHGFLHKNASGNLTINLQFAQENYIYCSITDDGIGRERSTQLKKQNINAHDSQGMKITKDRLTILNSISNQPIHLKINDLTDENGQPSGTKIEIWFPYQQ